MHKIMLYNDKLTLGLLTYQRPKSHCGMQVCMHSCRFLMRGQWWVSSTPFGVPFRLPVQFQNRGSSPFIICK